MAKDKFNTPILFLIFNRPEETKHVFQKIKEVKPKKLFVAADGPRKNVKNEIKKCKETRNIVKNIDCDCQIETLYRDENLGCKKAVSSAIDWFFENVEEGIILEDDCLPSLSFFTFCQELLKKYKDDERIMMISGFNKQEFWHPNRYDYFFSRLGGIWGWATWKRSWSNFDIKMKKLDKFIKQGYYDYLYGSKFGTVRKKQMLTCLQENIDTWDYQWGFSREINGGLSCVPSKSLIKNIGFGENATHTKNLLHSKIGNHNLDFPLKNNPIKVPDMQYDKLYLKKIPVWKKIIRKIKSL